MQDVKPNRYRILVYKPIIFIFSEILTKTVRSIDVSEDSIVTAQRSENVVPCHASK